MLQEGIRGQTHWNHTHRKLVNLITLGPQPCLTQWNQAMPEGATQDRWVMVERSDRTWSTGEGNGKPFQFSCLETPMNSMKRQKNTTLKDETPRSVGAQYATGQEWRNFRLKLKKVGKTTRSFRYDLNQIPYNYTVQVTNRFKGLDLGHTWMDRVPEEPWTEICNIVQEPVIKTILKKKKYK